jgi:hypothetical protein
MAILPLPAVWPTRGHGRLRTPSIPPRRGGAPQRRSVPTTLLFTCVVEASQPRTMPARP